MSSCATALKSISGGTIPKEFIQFRLQNTLRSRNRNLKPKQEKGCIKFVPNFVAIPTLRRVAVWDEQNQQVIELITNYPRWTANTIGQLYKSRWHIEIFFRE